MDTIHSDKTTDGLIALIEVDMNKNLELVYITPDFLVSLSTLFKHINLLLNQKDIIWLIKPNILITKAFIRQVANNSGIRCTLKPILKVCEILGSKGIAALEAKYNPSKISSSIILLSSHRLHTSISL